MPDFLTAVISLPGTSLIWAAALLPTLERKAVGDPHIYVNTHPAQGLYLDCEQLSYLNLVSSSGA